jgi:outer membrane protein assembly factor BamB
MSKEEDVSAVTGLVPKSLKVWFVNNSFGERIFKILSTRTKERRKMKINKKLLSTTIVSILMLTIIATASADSTWLPPGMIQPPAGFTPYQTWIYVTAASNPARLGATQTITAFITPPPPVRSGYNSAGSAILPVPYTNITIFAQDPNGDTVNLGNFTSGTSGGVWATMVPDVLGTYSVWATWDGTMIHQPAESKKITFEVTEEGSAAYDYPWTRPPAGYWETPVSAEYREWYTMVGPWYKSSGFNSSNTCFQEYSTAPNTAHVLWKYKSGSAGLIGGVYGPMGYDRAEYIPPNQHTKVVMDSLMYYSVGRVLFCIDTKTGLEKWTIQNFSGSGLFGIPAAPLQGPYTVLSTTPVHGASLYTRIGNDLTWIDAQTGIIVRTVNIPAEWRSQIGGTGTVDIGVDGAVRVYWATANGNLTKWNMFAEYLTATGTPQAGLVTTFQDGIIYSNRVVGGRTPGIINGNRFTSTTGDVRFPFVGFDTDTGALLYNVTREYSVSSSATSGYGKVFAMCSDGYWRAWSMDTGLEVWKATYPDAYPWGYFTVYNSAAAYGNYYGASYSGYVNCFDAATGENKWNYFAGKTTETSMGHYGYWGAPAVADGKIFVSAGSQHPISSPFERGANLIALNATTGEEIWKFSMRDGGADSGTKAIAEGKLYCIDGYTGYEFCFDKGKTATTLQVGPKSSVYGSDVVIEGTVKDLSSANQLYPACVSDESMTPWMEYCNINGPMPTNTTGVEVTLSVLDSNNNYRDIGTATTDPYNDGFFTFAWKPDIKGGFTVYATFKGTESYWSSNTATSFVVAEAPAPTAAPAAPVDNTPALNGILAAVIVAIVIGLIAIFLTLKKK